VLDIPLVFLDFGVEGHWVSLFYLFHCLFYQLLITLLIETVFAPTLNSADLPVGETLTVELQAFRFRAGALLRRDFFGGGWGFVN